MSKHSYRDRRVLGWRSSRGWFRCALHAEARGDHAAAATWLQLAVEEEAVEAEFPEEHAKAFPDEVDRAFVQ